jgi:heme/copper-type cytochrome/quinol oxidase subunit 3
MLARVITSVAAVVLSAAWFIVFMYSTLVAPQSDGAHAGPSAATWLGVVVIIGLAVSGVAAALAAAVAVLQKQKTRASWLLIGLALTLGGAWLIAFTLGVFDCNPDVGNCAGQ